MSLSVKFEGTTLASKIIDDAYDHYSKVMNTDYEHHDIKKMHLEYFLNEILTELGYLKAKLEQDDE